MCRRYFCQNGGIDAEGHQQQEVAAAYGPSLELHQLFAQFPLPRCLRSLQAGGHSDEHDCHARAHDNIRQVLPPISRNLELKFVYLLFDKLINKNDPNFIFFLCVALIGQREREIVEAS